MPKMTLFEAIQAGIEKPYWVEADRSAMYHERIIGYSVWHFTNEGVREKVHSYPHGKTMPLQIAYRLANMMRDDLNANIE